MDMELLTTILSSTLIAGLVSAGVTLYTGRKKNMIDHITSERKAWRDEIREIAIRIEAADTKEDLRRPLAKLKVRINAFGIQDDDVLHDSAVWKTIDALKGADDSKIPMFKERLLRLLSCVLKYDWERSKFEIRGSVSMGFSIVMQIVAIVVAVAAYLLNPANINVIFLGKIREIEFFVMPIFVFMLTYFFLYGGPLSDIKKSKNIISSKIQLLAIVILIVMVLFLLHSSGLNMPWMLAFASVILTIFNRVKDLDIPDQYKQTVEAIMKDNCQSAPPCPQNTVIKPRVTLARKRHGSSGRTGKRHKGARGRISLDLHLIQK